MSVIDAGVADADENGSRADRRTPGIRRVDVSARRAGCTVNSLADVEQVPQVRKARIVGLVRGVQEIVRLGVQRVGTPRQLRDEGLDVLAARTSMPHAAVADEPVAFGVNVAAQAGEIRGPAESNEDLAGGSRVAAYNFNLGDRGEVDDG